MQILVKLKKFWRIPRIEKVLLVKGIFMSLLFYFIVNKIPLRGYVKFLKSNRTILPDSLNDINMYNGIIRRTIIRIEKLSPLKINCLIRSLTAKFLFKHFNIESEIKLVLFESKNKTKCAHAFLVVENLNFDFNRIVSPKFIRF